MSKITELREKYSKVTENTFNRIIEGDKTPTKKYSEYLLKSWSNRTENGCPSTINGLIKLVNSFEELLPYVVCKDIYDSRYNDMSCLKRVLDAASDLKDEKTFLREEHAVVLEETDDYLFIQPITHKGSLKYGANTKWCTASKHNPQVFKNYDKNGVLIYLIDKKNTKQNGCNKVAFYKEYIENNYMTGDISVYNTNDSEISDATLVNNGWSEELIMRFIYIFKYRLLSQRKQRKSKEFIDTFSYALTTLNFENLEKHLQILEQVPNVNYISNIHEQLEEFTKNLKKYQNGFTKA